MRTHKERHIELILNGLNGSKPLIKNKNHLRDAKNYIIIRNEVDKVNTNTQDADLIGILYLSRFLKDKTFQQATRKDIREWSNWLKEKYNLSSSTVNLYQTKLKRFYKYISEPDKFENGRADQKDIRYPDCVRWIAYDDNSSELPIESILR